MKVTTIPQLVKYIRTKFEFKREVCYH